jgi:hypothetical protein
LVAAAEISQMAAAVVVVPQVLDKMEAFQLVLPLELAVRRNLEMKLLLLQMELMAAVEEAARLALRLVKVALEVAEVAQVS